MKIVPLSETLNKNTLEQLSDKISELEKQKSKKIKIEEETGRFL